MTGFAAWEAAPQRPTIGPDEVAVWRLPSDHPRPLETVLARYLGVDTGSVRLERTPLGKPVLPGSPLRFSLAHSGDIALVAVAEERDVGVDVERIRPDVDGWALVDHALTARERQQLKHVPAARRAHAFLSMWTRKEALLKAAGVGLVVDPVLVELDGDRVFSAPPVIGSSRDWTLLNVPLRGYVAAVAVQGIHRLTCIREPTLKARADRRLRMEKGKSGQKSYDLRKSLMKSHWFRVTPKSDPDKRVMILDVSDANLA